MLSKVLEGMGELHQEGSILLQDWHLLLHDGLVDFVRGGNQEGSFGRLRHLGGVLSNLVQSDQQDGHGDHHYDDLVYGDDEQQLLPELQPEKPRLHFLYALHFLNYKHHSMLIL